MSLHLGTIGNKVNQYSIRAFTNDLPFGSFSASKIGDKDLYSKMLSERFKSLQSGRTIYCTAVNPDIIRQIEENPHDSRLGTVHVAAVDERTGKLSCILSVAVDTGEEENGELVGLPLENRWRQNGYPQGSSLDEFRTKYAILNREEEGPVKPWQMAELYRHFRVNGDPNDQISRLGIYVGLYHLLVREPRNRGKEETSIWVFDAIPKYFHLYRLAGAAVLRDPTIEAQPRHISPTISDIKLGDGGKCLLYKDELISRSVETFKPIPGILGDLGSVKEEVPFLDGVIDIGKMEQAVKEDPLGLTTLKYEGMTNQDMEILRIAVSIFGKRHYSGTYSGDKKLLTTIGSKRTLLLQLGTSTE